MNLGKEKLRMHLEFSRKNLLEWSYLTDWNKDGAIKLKYYGKVCESGPNWASSGQDPVENCCEYSSLMKILVA
jgi:hypothetical protein